MAGSKTDIVSIKDIFLTLQRFWKLLLKKWLTISIIVLIFAGLGYAVSVLKKPLFKAKLTFVLDVSSNQSSLGTLAGLASQLGITSGGNNSVFDQDNIIEILKSKNIIFKALLTENDVYGKKEILINHYLKFNEYYDQWKENKILRDYKFKTTDPSKLSRMEDSLLSRIYKEINASVLTVEKLKPQLDIILIKTQSKDEAFSYNFTQNLIRSVTDFYIQSKTQRARETFDFLQKRADSTKTALDNAEMELAKWQDSRNQLVKYEGQVEKAKLMRNAEILQVVYVEILKNLEISKMNLLNITPLVKVIDSPTLPLDLAYITWLMGILIGGGGAFVLTVIFLFIRMIILEAIEKEEELAS